MSRHFGATVQPVYSFTLNRRSSTEFLASWSASEETTESDGRTIRRHNRTDPETGIVVRCDWEVFGDFPAAEWVVTLENTSDRDTPLLEAIQTIDATLLEPAGKTAVLHRALGSNAARSDFAPVHEELAPGASIRLAPIGGRSSNTASLPFFNLKGDGAGVVMAIGWSGQWAASWTHGHGVRVTAGMERTRLKLRPGESIRTPRVLLLFWEGDDELRGNNLFRRLVLAHRCPQQDGSPTLGPLAATGSPGIDSEFNAATELNQLASAERYRQFGYEPEYWWIDAGWYEGKWPNGVGNWFARTDGFPNGLMPISDGVRAMGYEGFLLWFEPERVHRGTWIDREHPEWVLDLPDHANGLLDLGNPDALHWLTEHVSTAIERDGIGFFRQDFNMDPLPYWRAHDEPEREGIHEIRHVEGLYAFWDALLSRHPGLRIDNCASGGRRIDLETTWRSVPLWRTDYQYFEPNGYQCHTYGLNHYVPLSATGSGSPDLYAFRSGMNSGIVLGWYLWDRGFPIDLGKRCLDEYMRLRHLYLGDFYPLTEHSTADDVWMAYQFHRDDLDEGMVFAFRRQDSGTSSIRLSLRGLDPAATYEVEIDDEVTTATGAELARLDIAIDEPRGSALVHYFESQGRARVT
ncbi:alpha-galactosidase [Candidatus Poribacteria bacterium]|nr:alpha-galactosidase [Candidatus Poribacteria bacterium]